VEINRFLPLGLRLPFAAILEVSCQHTLPSTFKKYNVRGKMEQKESLRKEATE